MIQNNLQIKFETVVNDKTILITAKNNNQHYNYFFLNL